MIDKPSRPSTRSKRNLVSEVASGQLRRAPNQPRASLTIQIIFEAAAQIMESEGLAGLTTNRIAEQAGYAVGTVYQYFKNKENLLLAMAMHEIAEVAHITHKIMDSAAERPLNETLRATVRAWINAFGGRHRVQYLMMQAVMDQGAFPEFHSKIAEVADDLGKKLTALPLKGVQPLSPSGQFVITRALLGTIRYGFLEHSPLLHQTALEIELVNMMRGMLLAPPEDSTD